MPYDPKEVPKEKRFRANLSDAFLSGDVSGQRAHSLFADAEDAGASNVGDLAGNHQPGMNSARDLTRKLLKEHQWPHLYWASIPVWSEKEQQEKEELLPFLLPHEILHQFSQFSDISQFRNFDSLPTEDMEVLQRGADILQTEAEQLLPLGMWMDGVPCNWDRSHSLNVLTLACKAKKEYSHTPLWFEAAFRGETQYYGCDAESFLLVSGMPFFGYHAIPAA